MRHVFDRMHHHPPPVDWWPSVLTLVVLLAVIVTMICVFHLHGLQWHGGDVLNYHPLPMGQ